MKKLFTSSALLLLLVFQAMGGWYIVATSNEAGAISEEKLLISDTKILTSYEETDLVFNTKNKQIIYIDHSLKAYWRGTSSEVAIELDRAQEIIMEEMLKKMPEAQREQFRDRFKKQKEEKKKQASKVYKVEFKKTTTSEKVLDYTCTKYEVFVDGILKEEVWQSTELKPLTKEHINALKEITNAFAKEKEYSDMDSYHEFMQKGYILKRNKISMESGKREVIASETTQQVEKTDIADEKFEPKEGYKEHSLSNILIELSKREEEE